MYKDETKLAQIGNRADTAKGSVNFPVYFSTAYAHSGIGESTGYDYSRTGNPTRELAEKTIADLEGGEQGFAFSSGMAALTALASLFKAGDEWIVCKDLYGGTYRLFEKYFKSWGLSCTYIDTSCTDKVEANITPQTKAIFIETPTNPLMELSDISALSTLASKNNIRLIVDNTLFTPILQKPILLGADIVLHSATKYLSGHNDVLAGLIVASDNEICNALSQYQNATGGVLSPFDSWLLMRGMKTLALRMKKHEENAKSVALFLNVHDAVTDVFYPGAGGMLSFRLQNESWINPFLKNLSLITFAESLGGTESFITYPATQTHADIPEAVRFDAGVCNRLLRFSIGIEDPEDLLEDLQHALTAAKRSDTDE